MPGCNFCCGLRCAFDCQVQALTSKNNWFSRLPDHLVRAARQHHARETLKNVVRHEHGGGNVLLKMLRSAATYKDVLVEYVPQYQGRDPLIFEVVDSFEDYMAAQDIGVTNRDKLCFNYPQLIQCRKERSRTECLKYVAQVCGDYKRSNCRNFNAPTDRLQHVDCINYMVDKGYATWDSFTMSADRVSSKYFERFAHTWAHNSDQRKRLEIEMIFHTATHRNKHKLQYLEFLAAHCQESKVDISQLAAKMTVVVDRDGTRIKIRDAKNQAIVSVDIPRRRELVRLLWQHFGVRLNRQSFENLVKLGVLQ